jgi:hypothetical protein
VVGERAGLGGGGCHARKPAPNAWAYAAIDETSTERTVSIVAWTLTHHSCLDPLAVLEVIVPQLGNDGLPVQIVRVAGCC